MAVADNLFIVDGTFGRSYTLEEPCGAWCSLGDWNGWVRTIERAQTQAKLAADDVAASGSNLTTALRERLEQWDRSWDSEPQTLSQLQESAYKGDSKAALLRLVELGKVLRTWFADAAGAITSAGGISKIPTGPSPKGSSNGEGMPWWVWAAGAFATWYVFFREKGDE